MDGHFDLYGPKWSQTIFDELHKVMIEKGMPQEKAAKQIERIDVVFPDAMINNYEELITTLSLPDKKDLMFKFPRSGFLLMAWSSQTSCLGEDNHAS